MCQANKVATDCLLITVTLCAFCYFPSDVTTVVRSAFFNINYKYSLQLPDLLFTLMKGGSQERTCEDDFAFSVLLKMKRTLGLFQHV